jgi:transposase
MRGRIEPVKIREALRLRAMRLSNVDISRSTTVQCSRTTLIGLFRKCDAARLDYPQAAQLTDKELERRLYTQAQQVKVKIPDPDFSYYQDQLKQHAHLNLKFLWEKDYRVKNLDGLGYSQFCERFRRWNEASGQNLTLTIDRKPGETMEVDWAGDTPALVCDRQTGELQEICLFVASLGHSGRLYAEAFPDMKKNSWISANTHALEYFGALPRILIPDNTKTAVKKAGRYDYELNPLFLEWAQFYGVAIIPARPGKPRDKPNTEEGVGWLETWLLGQLRHRYFFSYKDLNQAILEILAELDVRPYQKRAGSRLSVFLKIDLPVMRPLPAQRFEYPEFKIVTLGSNYHIEFDQTLYSVPYTYYQKKVTVRATSTTIEVLYDNCRICSHPRNYNSRRRYVTLPEHMPEKHRQYLAQSDWNGDRFRSWAKKIGINTYALIDALLNSSRIEEQAYKSCMGILQLARKYDEQRLEAACGRARSLSSNSYKTVVNILKNGQDEVPLLAAFDPKPLPDHSNIRGAKYFK